MRNLTSIGASLKARPLAAEMLTLEMIRAAVDLMRKNQVKPRVMTKKMAAKQNRINKELGLPENWKAGDEYYLLHEFNRASCVSARL